MVWEDNDPANPLNWSLGKKWMVTLSGEHHETYPANAGVDHIQFKYMFVAATITGLSAAASSIIAIGYPSMERELNCTHLQATATLSLYAFG